jgi:hypothetical protein
MTGESDLRRHRADANRLRGEVSKVSSTVAAQRKKASAATIAAGKSKSAATVRSKLNEAERASKAANDAETKRAGLEKKLAAAEVNATKAQVKVDRERQTSQDRAMRNLEQRANTATAQFAAPRRLGESTRSETAAGGSPTPRADVFLSHASEDKDEIARPLKDALEARGVSVWFDEIRIKVGSSIRQEIEKGISDCRFGVVILSTHFFAKPWTNAEMDALFTQKMNSGENLVLPIWHKVTKDEVMSNMPLLGGILALNSSVMTIDEIADALAEAVNGSADEDGD